MPERGPQLEAKEPKNVFLKPLQADFKEVFKALSNAAIHTAFGKWDELGADLVDTLSAIGLTVEPEELAFLLIKRSLTKALFDLTGECIGNQLSIAGDQACTPLENLDCVIAYEKTALDTRFFDRPAALPLVKKTQALFKRWLEAYGVAPCAAEAISNRLPAYFVYALHREWRKNAKSYRPLLDALETPFTAAAGREWAWRTYGALLQRHVQESIFDESFSLSQIYVPLNAYYIEDEPIDGSCLGVWGSRQQRRRVVVSLQAELEKWLSSENPQDAIRVISGGPGSGKSSFARMFAAHLSSYQHLKVLYVPLHLIDPANDLIGEIGRFVKQEGVLPENPLEPDSREPNLLIIFDGLDELASQGKAAAETARAFIREVERTVERSNLHELRLRVLFSGRELIVQENESEFRHPRQVLVLLPYFLKNHKDDSVSAHDREVLYDPNGLLKVDLRHLWWKKYGDLSGKVYDTLPRTLNREELEEITGQPLLNYLVALSFVRGKLDFAETLNLNMIYADLVSAVYERGYEKHGPYGPIRHMKQEEFSRVLEEIGLSTWHGDGRSATVREIEEHCEQSGVDRLLKPFQEGAKVGVTRLLAAFFFRQYEQRAHGDPTFIFTHKSFGEFLAAKRITRAIQTIINERCRREENLDTGWDERDSLQHLVQICGPTSISQYLHVFFFNEIRLYPTQEVLLWQNHLARLFEYMLRNSMPMERFHIKSFKIAVIFARNAEESLLMALNACAKTTKFTATMSKEARILFSSWLKAIQGRYGQGESSLAVKCLSFLDLSEMCLDNADLSGADLRCSNLRAISANDVCFRGAQVNNADLRDGVFERANFNNACLEHIHLENANLKTASLENVCLKYAQLENAHLEYANLEKADFTGACLKGAYIGHARLRKANFDGASLSRCDLRKACLNEAHFERADLECADLNCASCKNVHFEFANLSGANIKGADLSGTDFTGANLGMANLNGADLQGAILFGANLFGASLENTEVSNPTSIR